MTEALVTGGGSSAQEPPAFVAAPGKFRILAQHGTGNQRARRVRRTR